MPSSISPTAASTFSSLSDRTKKSRQKSTRKISGLTRIHQLASELTQQDTPAADDIDQVLHINQLCTHFDSIEVPEGDRSHDKSLMAFYTGINALHDKGISSYLQRPCAVCNNTGHAFQDCPLLQKSALVATAYGKLKTKLDNLCRYKYSVNQTLSDPHSPNDVPVNSL